MRYLLAMLAVMALAVPAMAQSATPTEGNVPVEINVQSFVEIHVLDTEGVTWDVAGTGSAGDMGANAGTHARFEVMANDLYDLLVESSNGTWGATGELPSPWDAYKQVKFVKDDGSGEYTGGSLYLRPVSSTGTAQTFQYWDGDAGNIQLTGQSAGIYVWGVAAGVDTKLNGDPDTVASPGTYKTDAVVTVSVQ